MSSFRIICVIFILLAGFGFARAQDDFDKEDQTPNPGRQKPNLLRELGLSPEQIREIKSIDQTNRRILRVAQQKVIETRRGLDQAIYSENADEETIEQKLREFQTAQAEIARIRAYTEFSIRKILTPEQLVRFRELRQKFEQFRRDRRKNQGPLRMRGQRQGKRRPPAQNQ